MTSGPLTGILWRMDTMTKIILAGVPAAVLLVLAAFLDFRAKKRFITWWLAKHGTEAQQQQWEDGLLCLEWAVDIMRRQVLDHIRPGGGFNSIDAERISYLTELGYAEWQSIKPKLPPGSTWKFVNLDFDGRFIEAVIVSVKVGPLLISRTFRLDQKRSA